MNKTLWLVFFLVFPLSICLHSQQGKADSIISTLNQLSGERKVDALNSISDIYYYIDYKTSIDYATQAMNLALEINYPKGLAASYGCLGFTYISIDMQKAVYYTQKALEIRRRIHDKPGIATSLNVLGLTHYFTGNYAASIEYHLQALSIREEIGDDNKILGSYNNIALVFMAIENYETSLEYLNKALQLSLKMGKNPATVYTNMGEIYLRKGNYDKAFSYFENSLVLNKQLGYNKSIANSYKNIADTYKKLNDTTGALKTYRLALDLYLKMDEKNGIAQCENGLAETYKRMNRLGPAIEHAQNALQNALPIHALDRIAVASGILNYCYTRLGNIHKAYEYLQMYHNATDSLQSIEKIKRLSKTEFDYKIEKIRKQQEAELGKQKAFNMTLTVVIFLLVVIVVLVIWGYNNKKTLTLRLQDLNSAKDRFLSIIAHDLRGPFQGLLSSTEMLASQTESLSNDDIRELSNGLNLSLQKQFRLLNDLLDWYKLQSGNFTLSAETVALRSEICSIMESLALSASQKEINIINNVDAKITIHADPNMIRLVLRNLISNAIKFSNRCGTIKISARDKKTRVEVTVEDNGIGMTKESIDKLFRIDISHSTKGTQNEPGSGLGLILCKEIIEKHSGQIHVESRLTEGSRFIFTIPAAKGR